MGTLYQQSHKYISSIAENSVFVEIGSERGEGSTEYFSKLAKVYNTQLYTVDIEDLHFNLENVIFTRCIGSEWCYNYSKINKSISVAYFDNYDYLYDESYSSDTPERVWTRDMYNSIAGAHWPPYNDDFNLMPAWIQQEVKNDFGLSYDSLLADMRKNYMQHGFQLTNSECQLEHFQQIYALFPWFTDACVIVLDDTFRYNNCWIGKSGPAVLLLQSLGFLIVEEADHGVILKRNG